MTAAQVNTGPHFARAQFQRRFLQPRVDQEFFEGGSFLIYCEDFPRETL